MLQFGDVVRCKDVAEFQHFVDQYFIERNLDTDGSDDHVRRLYWALFYRWKGSFGGISHE